MRNITIVISAFSIIKAPKWTIAMKPNPRNWFYLFLMNKRIYFFIGEIQLDYRQSMTFFLRISAIQIFICIYLTYMREGTWALGGKKS